QREIMTSLGGVERVNIVSQDVPSKQIGIADTSPGKTIADVIAIRDTCPLISAVSPIYEQSAVFMRGGNDFRGRARGVWPDHVAVNAHTVQYGRNICQLDLDEARHVCVIGTKIVAELWPENPEGKPLGETILVNSKPFVIV